ncbi:hypothetical protein MMC10_008893 [Thelotrema lepadinum]|nr:hypothetical protein [Thelotrema lepadinum]
MPSDEPATEQNTDSQSPQSNQRFSLTRVHTGLYPDDASVYHPEGEREKIAKGRDASSSDDELEDTRVDGEEDGVDEVPEVREGIADVRDIEKGDNELEKKKTVKSVRSNRSIRDPNEVTWDGPDDPLNPKNWAKRKKWTATFVVSLFTLISPVSSSMVAPSTTTIAQEFDIDNAVIQQMFLSVFVLAYAVGPLFIGPLSEIYGRVHVLQIANLFFLVFNTACGGCTSAGQMIAFRFLAGLGGSAPQAIGGGVLGDAWSAEERGAAMAVYSLMPLLGPAIGPIAGAWITERTTWRWSFYSVSIACALVQLNGLFSLRETYAPTILFKKARRLRKETGNPLLRTKFEASAERTPTKILTTAFSRPFILLGTQPIVQFLALYMAFLYGLMYLVLSTFPLLFTGTYHESLGISGLNYISLGLGFWAGAQLCAPLNDRIYRHLKATLGKGKGRPEFRVPLMLPGSIIIPIGLFIYGWTAQYQTHWIGPNIGAVLFSMGSIIGFQCIQTYLVDSYTRYAASAVGAAAVLRSLFGFGFPLFAPYMYAALGYGWGNSLLGFLAIGLGVPAPVVLWYFGEKMRGRSRFAAGGGD